MIRLLASVLPTEPVVRSRTPARPFELALHGSFEPKPPRPTPPMEVDEVGGLAAELAIQRVAR